MTDTSRSKRMESVARIAESREKEAARALSESQRALDAHRQRLEELQTYKAEYNEQFGNACSGGMDAVKLHEYRAFLSRLTEAVEQQQRLVEQARRECEQKRQQWLDSHTRTRSLDKATERFQEQERREADRRQQKESDDHPRRPDRQS